MPARRAGGDVRNEALARGVAVGGQQLAEAT
jgi:hypothetical protein